MKLMLIICLGILLISCGEGEKVSGKKVSGKKGDVEVRSIHETEAKDSLKGNLKIFSDEIIIKTTEENIISENFKGRLSNPKFCGNGEKLFFTLTNFSKIFSYNFISNEIAEIIAGPKIGYNYSVSENGELLYSRQLLKNFESGKRENQIVETNIETNENRILYSSSERLTSPIKVGSSLFFHENDIIICFELNNSKIIQSSDNPYIFVRNNKLFKSKYAKEFQLFEQREDFVSVYYSSDFRYVKCLTKNNGIDILDIEGNFIKSFLNAISLSILPNSNLVVYSVQEDDGITIKSSKLFIGFLNSDKSIKIENNSNKNRFNPTWSVKNNKIAYSTNDDNIAIISVNIEK